MNESRLRFIAEIFEKEVCPKCNVHPKVEVIEGKLQFQTCCENFKDHLYALGQSKLYEHVNQEIKKSFKGLIP